MNQIEIFKLKVRKARILDSEGRETEIERLKLNNISLNKKKEITSPLKIKANIIKEYIYVLMSTKSSLVLEIEAKKSQNLWKNIITCKARLPITSTTSNGALQNLGEKSAKLA